jgi:hypothetical protein
MTSVLSLAAAVLTPGALLIAAVLSGIGLRFARRLALRLGTTRPLAISLIISLALIVSLTLGSRHYTGSEDRYWLGDPTLWAYAWTPDANALLNAALFIPAGALLAFTTRRTLLPAATLAALSIAIEHVQMLTGWGSADPADLIWNTLGGIAGVVVGRLAISVTRRVNVDV